MSLTQIISNFINNAIKHTSIVTILLGYEIRWDEIEFSVTDTGDGMSPEVQRHVFDRFFKGKAPQSNRGLYIDAMRNKAELYVMMGKEQEAFKQFANVYAYVKSVFNKNYPKEIDRPCTRFHAYRLMFMNDHRRSLPNR